MLGPGTLKTSTNMTIQPTDMRIKKCTLYLLPIEMRMPLKFGTEVLTHISCARVCMKVADPDGRTVEGWGETPLSAAWAWPSQSSYSDRFHDMVAFCSLLTEAWTRHAVTGHALEVGYAFLENELVGLTAQFNRSGRTAVEPMPYLAALICCSAFDLALHDAFGKLVDRPVYETYQPDLLGDDLATYFENDTGFAGRFPIDFLAPPPTCLPVWHLVGGLDPLDQSELTGDEPSDGYPVTLVDWIKHDGLDCLKVKLRGNDADWDYDRLTAIGKIAADHGSTHLSADFNCTVTDPAYVNEILDRLKEDQPAIFHSILYIEQPFAYDLEANRIDVRSLARRKPLFMDESAHDWRLIRLGRDLGWTGVALKTCKTQTGALLSLCWAKANNMALMVQDLTNPMLAQIPHVLLASHAQTIMGVESNGMQFYPAASAPEACVHPGLYQRQGGQLDLSTITGSGFGYRIDEIERQLPPPVLQFET